MTSRFYSLMSLVAAVALGTALFMTSESVQRAEKTYASLREKSDLERDSLRVMNAEWTYLNRPDRLEQLATAYLNLAPASAQKVVGSLDVVPESLTPVLPGVKPAIVPADFTAAMTAPPSPPSPLTAPAATPKKPSPASLRFDQLINRIADNGTLR